MSNTHPKSELEEFDEMQQKMLFQATEAGMSIEEAQRHVSKQTRTQYLEIFNRMNEGLRKAG
jgi:hypothetical protein